ncbi:MAG: 3-hydroxybutyrate dehydrogenase [Bacteroidia bacterium]|nr:3-hydroxybutyrate dehydrogenase [Bacteroidia bacterium]
MKKTALITGSTSGIGLAIANNLASKGYNIVFNGLETNGAEIAADIAQKHGIDYLFSPCNLLYPDQIETMATEALAKFGKIDVLVNNAGIQFVSPVQDFPLEKWNQIIAINLTATFILTKHCFPSMLAQKFGRIVNIASAHGLVASEYKSAYIASKHGVVGFTKTIALEGAPHNITCNAICPGYVHTPIVENQIGDQMKAHNLTREEVIQKVMLSKQAIKSFISVDSIVQMAAFLISDEAATITGTAIPVDGGWTAQ